MLCVHMMHIRAHWMRSSCHDWTLAPPPMELVGSAAVVPPPTPPSLQKRQSPLAHLRGLAILEGVGVGTAWYQ